MHSRQFDPDDVRRPRPPSGLLRQFVKETRIRAPQQLVFRFHESPDALTRLIPPWEKMVVAEAAGSLQVGSRVVLRGRIGCIPVQWVAVHTEYEPPHYFADQQLSGPFTWWYHTHRFVPEGPTSTLLRDEVEYVVPLGLIGRLVAERFVRRKLERMFDYRHEVTRRLIESGEWSEPSTAN